MNMDALREDLKYWDDWSGDDWPLGNLSNVLAAARAVLDSEEVWWCAKHSAQIVNDRDKTCWDAERLHACRPVRRRLLP